VLVAVGQVLAASVRGEDLVCRWGGEEFVGVVFCDEPTVAFDAAERIRSAVASDVRAGDNPVTVSVGVAHRVGRSSVDAVLKVADVALLEAKRAGRNRVVVSSP